MSQNQNILEKSKVELSLYNYTKKADLRNVAAVDTSKFPKKADLLLLLIWVN